MKVKITLRRKCGNANYPTQAKIGLEWAIRGIPEEFRVSAKKDLCHAAKETPKNEV